MRLARAAIAWFDATRLLNLALVMITWRFLAIAHARSLIKSNVGPTCWRKSHGNKKRGCPHHSSTLYYKVLLQSSTQD